MEGLSVRTASGSSPVPLRPPPLANLPLGVARGNGKRGIPSQAANSEPSGLDCDAGAACVVGYDRIAEVHDAVGDQPRVAPLPAIFVCAELVGSRSRNAAAEVSI